MPRYLTETPEKPWPGLLLGPRGVSVGQFRALGDSRRIPEFRFLQVHAFGADGIHAAA